MKVRITVNHAAQPTKRDVFVIEGELIRGTNSDAVLQGLLFGMEYAINEHVPYVRCHIEVIEQ